MALPPQEGVGRMASEGMIREMDNVGRIVVPKEWRRQFRWGFGTPFQMAIADGGLILRPVGRACRICGNAVVPGHCIELEHRQWVCSDCAAKVADAQDQWRR